MFTVLTRKLKVSKLNGRSAFSFIPDRCCPRGIRDTLRIGRLVPQLDARNVSLAKLRWYQAGEVASTNQWNDVVGILGTSRESLDMPYLHNWADKLGVTALLQKAIGEVEEDSTAL